MLERLIERWRGLPRAAKWGVLAAAGIVLYYGVVDPALAARQRHAFEAERSSKRLEEYTQQSRKWKDAQESIKLGTIRFGEVALPSAGTSVVSSASTKIREALSDRGITEWNIQTQRGVPVGRGVLGELTEEEGEELQRVTFQVTLEDSPEVVAAVLAEIERMPEVTTIGQVQMRRVSGDERRVQATLTPETWVIVRREERR